MVEKKNPVLISQVEEQNKTNKIPKKVISTENKIEQKLEKREGITGMVWKKELTAPKKDDFSIRNSNNTLKEEYISSKNSNNISEFKTHKQENKGIPVIKNNILSNDKIQNKITIDSEIKIFPDIPLNKEEKIFPEFPTLKNNTSFFDDNEFDDLKSCLEEEKKGWF